MIDPALWGARRWDEGEPDFHHPKLSIWLHVKGPPFALRFARYAPTDELGEYDFYHRHDTVDSIHIITQGTGFYAVGGQEFRVAAGMAVHHLRGVPHCGPFPDRDGMSMLVIQTPSSGHASDFLVCPDEGLLGKYRDRAAFVAKYGEGDHSGFGKLGLGGGGTKSAKWLAWHQ